MPTAPFLRLLLACLLVTAAHGAILYTEDFTGAGNGSVAGVGWEGWGALGDSATATTYTTSGGASPDARLFRTAGAGTNRALFAQSRNSGSPTVINDRFIATTTGTGSHSIGSDPELSLGSIQWDQAATVPGSQSVQVLVQVAGNWYASLASFTNTAASSAGQMTNIETKSLDLAGEAGLGTTAWYDITFGDDSPITLGSQVESPIGTTLTGIGFAILTTNGSTRTVWIDNVQLISVPEPSALVFSCSGLAALFFRRRRNA